MKRSEAIQDVAGELIIWMLDQGVEPPPYDKAKEFADIALSKLEDIGMRPPHEICPRTHMTIVDWEDE